MIAVLENEMPAIHDIIRSLNNNFGRGDVTEIRYCAGGDFSVTCKLQYGTDVKRAYKDEKGFIHFRGHKRKIKMP